MVLTTSQAKLQTGSSAPDFRLKGVDGKIHSADEFAGLLLVIFMCNHCPYVLAKIGSITRLQEKFAGKATIAGINSNNPAYPGEGFENMKKFAREQGINFPYLIDETQSVAKAYGAVCTPDPFLFDKNRKLVFHGRIDNALELDAKATEQTMENNINKVLRGERIKGFEPSMGCSIKWK
ncbi:MAG: thioredoxin family protein [Candidatus Aenigmarchaeota archaeon]|nr:thioredoxin family protein [Candidatus Aenigmarchaeota archaeon]